MKIKTLLCSIALTALLASCTTVQYQYSEARIADANTDVFVIPPTARVDVNPILFEDTWTFEGKELNALMYTGINSEVLTQRLKIAATHKTLKKHEGDILVAPLFNIISERDGRRFIVTIRGHVGTFTDWNKDTEGYIDLQKAIISSERQVEVITR